MIYVTSVLSDIFCKRIENLREHQRIQEHFTHELDIIIFYLQQYKY